MKLKAIALLLCLVNFACQNTCKESDIIFDANQWRSKSDSVYLYRDRMLNDLISSNMLRSLNKQQILELLGKPDRIDNNHLFYLVTQEYIGFYPLHTKTLVIKLLDEHTVEWVKIHE